MPIGPLELGGPSGFNLDKVDHIRIAIIDDPARLSLIHRVSKS
jgi:hypothetical protein